MESTTATVLALIAAAIALVGVACLLMGIAALHRAMSVLREVPDHIRDAMDRVLAASKPEALPWLRPRPPHAPQTLESGEDPVEIMR